MVNIYDIETVEFPLGTPQLRLSVSHEEYKPGTGLKVPFTLYVERYSLSTILHAKNQGDGEPARYSLFTNKLEVPGTPSGGKVGLSINGDAGNADHRDGRRGGELELFVEDLPLKTASCIFLEASGGAGFQPSAKLEEEGRDGGKGGDGGSVKMIYSPFVSQASAVVEKFLADLYDAQKKWPSGFQEDAAALEKVLADASTGPHVPLPSFMRTKSGILKSKKVVVRDQVKKLSLALSGESHGSIFASLTQAIAVHGGNRGFGSHGSKSDGADGEPGKDGTQVVKSTAILTEIHDTDVCFAHPVQCRMLLDQVGFLYFVGSLKSRAQGVILLERLQQRLEPFLSKPAVEPKLWKAYRRNAKRLCIVENNPVSPSGSKHRRARGVVSNGFVVEQEHAWKETVYSQFMHT
ncbi:hypothetical protein ED733_000172 [Metarhizium rileyi]|uniref:Uncharacterized protein n=1 Tax=Metarhizium rileyi (strain RCEF 4871) TaxID=1649241 RepID=A0A5C6G7F0_METRR|nr:hypothetical protein ED733_000172 [Metarhizium rileyi]